MKRSRIWENLFGALLLTGIGLVILALAVFGHGSRAEAAVAA